MGKGRAERRAHHLTASDEEFSQQMARGDIPCFRFAPTFYGKGRRRRQPAALHLIRKPRARSSGLPASIGSARGRRQYPDPGVADRLGLLAIVPLAVEEFLSGRLAGEGEELRTKGRDGLAQPGAIRRRQFRKRGAIHPRARFHEIGQADAMLQQAAILMRLQQLRREPRLVQNLPELVLPVRVVGPLGGGRRISSVRVTRLGQFKRLETFTVSNRRRLLEKFQQPRSPPIKSFGIIGQDLLLGTL